MGFKGAYENYKEHGLKYFTPKRAFIFLRSLIRKITGLRIKEKDVILYSEAVTYKALTCPDCAAAGKCKICKCPVNELFAAMDVGCSDGKFPAFESKDKSWQESWKEYKEDKGIFLTKIYS